MSGKLTLYIDDDLISYVKDYAKEHQLSVSKVVNNFLTILKQKIPKRHSHALGPTPITQSLKGILRYSDINANDYHKHLEDKYL